MSEISFQTIKRETAVSIPDELVFGRNFTDHVFEMDYNPAKGWHNPVIKKYDSLSMDPAAMVLHYGQAVFEGLKAYKQVDGKIALFRPEKNIARLNNSNRRMCIPEVDEKFVLKALLELIKVEKDWIPTKEGHSLYIRPFIFANDPFLGVKASDVYKLMIILSPVGPYYPEGFKPVPIMVTEDYVRAVRKGIGECKAAANYAASLMAQVEAKKLGYSQVLWLDGVEQKYIEEVGTMNIFIQLNDEVVTPMLNGSILPGITRMSTLEILRDWDYNINERMISIDEVMDAHYNGRLVEIFGTGTAAVISAVSKLKYRDLEIKFNENEAGELSKKLYAELTGIQYGTKEDKFGWITHLD
ncbi:MAG: branched-chain amino acid aminotransferase [Melioribacteraceae bacterium]|nr:branched-chain amino acid aminotransferase [Melioribacteraceae bacterium]